MNNGKQSILMAAIIASHFASVASAIAPVPNYKLAVAPFFQGADFGLVTGFNNSAQAVYDRISYGERAYWWNGTQEIELLPGAPQSQSAVIDLGDNGVAVGDRIVNGSTRLAMVWQQGVPHDLGTMGGPESEAGAINDQGVVAGWSDLSNGSKHLFTWNGTFTDLGQLPANSTCCYEVEAINNSSQIVGHNSGSLLQGWLFDNGHLTLLPDLNGGNDTTPRDINNAGMVVGTSWPQQTNNRPVTWLGGQVQALPMPANAVSGDARAVNELNQVVGAVTFGDSNVGYTSQATLWESGSPYLLRDLVTNLGDWQLWKSEDINDRGQILVFAVSNTYGYQRLILTPVPEPAGFVLGVIGFCSLTFSLRRASLMRLRKAALMQYFFAA